MCLFCALHGTLQYKRALFPVLWTAVLGALGDLQSCIHLSLLQ